MKQQLENCNPSICLTGGHNKPNDLMTEDGIFVTKEIYKTLCSNDCPNKQTCGTVIDKLQALKTDEALDLISNMKANG